MSCVPGYDDAVAREQYARNVAYLGQPEIVCGEPLRNLTPHLLGILTVARSPFIVGGPFDWRSVAQFLWALHVDFRKPRWYRFLTRSRKKRLAKKCALMDMGEARAEIGRYLELTDMDAPRGGKPERPIASNTAWICYRFQNEPWKTPRDVTKHIPFRILYQELRCWTREHTEETITSPSQVYVQTWQEKVNEQCQLWNRGGEVKDEYGNVLRVVPKHTEGFSPERLAAKNEEWRKARESGNN